MKGKKGRQGYTQRSKSDNRKFQRDVENHDTYNGRNDLSWYNKYPILLDTTAKFPYPYRAGDVVKMDAGNTTVWNYQIPGVLTVEWTPSVGKSNGPMDPASLLGKQMYDRVRKAFSGSIDADAPDFLIYMVCLDSIYAAIASLKRIYRIARAYSPDSRVLPDTLLHALGFNGDEVRQHLVDLLYATNELKYKIDSFVSPSIIDYFNRHYWMNDNVYADAPSVNSQLFAFKMLGMYTYSDKVNNGTSELPGAVFTSFGINSGVTTTAAYIKIIQDAIDAFVSWDDCYLISGYLKRAYEGVPSFGIDELRSDETFAPLYEPEVLTQIENCWTVDNYIFTGATVVTDTLLGNIAQDPTTNTIISNPGITFGYGSGRYMGSSNGMLPMFSCRSDVPTTGENVIMSRLKCYILSATAGTDAQGSTLTAEVTCASELPVRIKLYLPKNLSTQLPSENHVRQVLITPTFAAAQATLDMGTTLALFANLYVAASVTAFDWHPIMLSKEYQFSTTGIPILGTNSTTVNIFGDAHNVTVITPEQLQKLHQVCLYSEFSSFSQ